jgi:hypothetical protein
MPDTVRRVEYFYAIVSDKPGEAARILTTLSRAGVNLTGFSGFPHGARRSQLDFIPEDPAAFTRAAKQAGLKLSKKKVGFLIQGDDHSGAMADVAAKLAGGGINVTAVDAVCAGAGRYGALLWVKAPDLRRAAKLLGAL